MSSSISGFIIEQVVRQARRFSSRRDSNNSHTLPPTPSTINATINQTGFPDYVDPISDQRVGQEENNEDALLEDVTEGIRTIPRLEDQETETRDRAETDPEVSRRQSRPQEFLRRFASANSPFPTTINEAGMRIMEDSTMSTTSSATRRSVDLRLPADDGMHHLRKRILEIHGSDITNEEKSKLVHQIMQEQYLSNARAQSPASQRSDRPLTPTSASDVKIDSPGTSASLAIDELLVTVDDKKPTFWIPPPTPKDQSPDQSRKNSMDQERHFGCEHYKRNVKLQCSVCFKWYTCRFCHDKVEDHCLNRKATKNMLCMACGSAQPANGNCVTCGFCAAYYYCKLCKLWDDDSTKAIYHCDSCGICRRGEGLGKDFFHCQKCQTCISIRIMDTHKCIERSMDCDCPICGEYMFTSPKTVIFMRCGHTIHYDCWGEHMKNSYKCPICSKSMINMEMTFRGFDRDIELQPMPAKFQDTRAWIFCNDCENKSLVPFHWVGLKCISCDSYNTIRLDTISAPDDVDLGAPEMDLAPTRQAATLPGQTITDVHAGAVAIPHRNSIDSTRRESHEHATATSIDIEMPDEEEEDVDFWGGTSPRSRESNLPRQVDADEESDSSSDEDIDLMDEDDEGEDSMALFGHR